MAHSMEKVDDVPPPSEVGRLFLLQYYMKWSENAANVHQFYGTESYFNHDGLEAVGQMAIQKAIDKLNYENCKTRIHSVLGCYGANESLVIVVGGELSYGGSAPRRFVQNFVLNKQASKRYWVQSDVFQWVDKMFFEVGSTPSSTPVSAPANPTVNDGGDSEMDVKPLENSSPPPTTDNGVNPAGAAGGGGGQHRGGAGGGRGWGNGPPRYYNSHGPQSSQGNRFHGGGQGGGRGGGYHHGRGGSFGSGRGRDNRDNRDNRDKYTRNHQNNHQQQQERA